MIFPANHSQRKSRYQLWLTCAKTEGESFCFSGHFSLALARTRGTWITPSQSLPLTLLHFWSPSHRENIQLEEKPQQRVFIQGNALIWNFWASSDGSKGWDCNQHFLNRAQREKRNILERNIPWGGAETLCVLLAAPGTNLALFMAFLFLFSFPSWHSEFSFLGNLWEELGASSSFK